MRALGLLIAAALLAACGGEGDDTETAEKPATEETSATPTEVAPIGLAEACPRIEAIVDTGDDADADAWAGALREVDALVKDGDEQVKSLVVEITPAVEANWRYADAGRPAGEGLDAFSTLTDARESVAASCG